jgi:hypothetical protein
MEFTLGTKLMPLIIEKKKERNECCLLAIVHILCLSASHVQKRKGSQGRILPLLFNQSPTLPYFSEYREEVCCFNQVVNRL